MGCVAFVINRFEALLKWEHKSVLDLERKNCSILQDSNRDHPNAFSWFLLFSQRVCSFSRVFKNRVGSITLLCFSLNSIIKQTLQYCSSLRKKISLTDSLGFFSFQRKIEIGCCDFKSSNYKFHALCFWKLFSSFGWIVLLTGQYSIYYILWYLVS